VAAVPNSVISKFFGPFHCQLMNCENSTGWAIMVTPEFDRNCTVRRVFRDGAFYAIAVSAFQIHSGQNLADGSGGKCKRQILAAPLEEQDTIQTGHVINP